VTSVDLWCWLTGTLDRPAVDALVPVLSPDERERAARFHFDRDRRDYVAAHALVRHVLSRHAPYAPGTWRFDLGTHGKPFVADPAEASPLSFNLSHTSGLVACVVARGPAVGIDVEAVTRRTPSEAVVRKVFAREEVRALESLSEGARASRFADLWTLREAYVKAVGVGLWGPMVPPLRFSFDEPDGLRCHRNDDASPWQFALIRPSEGYRIAVAVEIPEANPHLALAVNVIDGSAEMNVVGTGALSWRGATAPPIRI
jgi:4'-phosphopantetheinyl transferase